MVLYVVFRSFFDGNWYRVNYQQRELIKIPYYAGWNIVAIKNVNWRYWTVTLQKPPQKSASVADYLVKCPYEA
jgi:hypothetical protein